MWIEQVVEKDGKLRGERFCMKMKNVLVKATLYYSDKRVVFDLDTMGGF